MFAFALWDRREKRMFLARDRFGEKPLYYAFRGEGLAFASELAALEQLKALDLRVSRDNVARYFTCGYVPAPHSIYENVFKLPPGCLLSWRAGRSAEDQSRIGRSTTSRARPSPNAGRWTCKRRSMNSIAWSRPPSRSGWWRTCRSASSFPAASILRWLPRRCRSARRGR